MSDKTRFDERRSAAWRAAIIENARADRSAAGNPRNHLTLIVGLVLAALVVSGGGVAYALSTTVLRPAAAPATTATPIERDTPSVTPPPSSASPTPSPTQDPVAIARGQARQACQNLASALDSNGNTKSADAWEEALARARHSAEAAAALDASLQAFASHVTALAQTPLPGPSATDAQKNSYSGTYLPVATDCRPLGIPLPSD